jgi:pantoate--beta-alanine ligase
LKQTETSVVASIAHVRERVKDARQKARSIGFVPTMGALHAGHRSLIEKARQDCRFVVVSIFVNPLQFDRKDDLERYPRTFEEDFTLCGSAGADLVFTPFSAELYPAEQAAFVDVPTLTEHLCGAFRPGHFRGVATVVLKLFQIVQPDRAYFGQKDAQQLAIIRRMVQDLNVPVDVVAVPTVRESDGLALSSRNKHLSTEQRQIAPALSRALFAAVEHIKRDERSARVIRDSALESLGRYPEIKPEYFELVDPQTLAPVEQVGGAVLIAGALWLGSTRLIDNVLYSGQ